MSDEHQSKIIKSDFDGLNNFVKAISSGDGWAVDVGIMGNKSYRSNSGKSQSLDKRKENANSGGLTNADIGFLHEFGTGKIPKRSFLRMPLFLKSEKILKDVKDAGAFQKLLKGNIRGILSDLGIAAVAAIEQAFDSAGFGSWASKKSGEGSPLIQTGQLRRSITYEVVKK